MTSSSPLLRFLRSFGGSYTKSSSSDIFPANMLSTRVQEALVPSPLSETFFRVLKNAYHPSTNPDGIISLGIAENNLMFPELAAFLDKNMDITPDLFGYGAVSPGLQSLKDGLVRLYNSDPFNPCIPVEAKDLIFSCGCSSLLDNLFWCLCDEGDGALIGKPLYGGFANDMKIRSKVKLVAVSLTGYDPFSKEAIVRFEEEFIKAEKEGIKVRMLVLCTPHNPLGQCYSREVMIEYMRFCQKHQIHLISDEIYALTTYATEDIPNPTPFTSLLSIPKDGIIDPNLCHVVHGMSKDFCGNGVRFGVLISQKNRDLHSAMNAIGFFTIPSSLAFQAFSTILNNETFMSEFLKLSCTRLAEHYTICTRFLRKYSIPYHPTNAGFFIWIDLSKFLEAMPGNTELAREKEMNKILLDNGVHLATSEQFYGEYYGWFRISFSVEKDILELALKRIIKAIGAVKDDQLESDNKDTIERLQTEQLKSCKL